MFSDRLAQAATQIQSQFDAVLGSLDDVPVTHAMAHATMGGKRLRGFLVLESARLHGLDPAVALWPATGIEAMHAYSLVHDDLPCMDDDDLRRGQPTVHVKWDEATAMLAGDALHALSFELVTHDTVGPARADLAHTLALAAGQRGMVLGQALDIAAETADVPLTLDQIEYLQRGKTGALIEWSACAGARMAGADTAPLRDYAQAMGMHGKPGAGIGFVAAGKNWLDLVHALSLLGLDGAKRRATELVQSACDALDTYGPDADVLRETAAFVIRREK